MAEQIAPPQDKNRPARRAGTSGARRGSGRSTTPSTQAARRLGSNSIVDFYRESVAELKKVTWPTWQDASNLTLAVVGMTLAIAAFLGIIDEILNYAIKPIIGQ